MFKFFVIIALVAASASAFQVSCEDCESAIDALSTYLSGDESIEKQIGILITNLCTSSSDPTLCESKVHEYWPQIARVLYGLFFTQKEPCGPNGLNVCTRNPSLTHPLNPSLNAILKDWTCGECTDKITKLSAIITKDAYVKEAIEYISGDAFCGRIGDPEKVEKCKKYIAYKFPKLVAILGRAIINQRESICKIAIGVC